MPIILVHKSPDISCSFMGIRSTFPFLKMITYIPWIRLHYVRDNVQLCCERKPHRTMLQRASLSIWSPSTSTETTLSYALLNHRIITGFITSGPVEHPQHQSCLLCFSSFQQDFLVVVFTPVFATVQPRNYQMFGNKKINWLLMLIWFSPQSCHSNFIYALETA